MRWCAGSIPSALLFELKNTANAQSIELYFGPNAPAGHEGQWIKTIPGMVHLLPHLECEMWGTRADGASGLLDLGCG
jgi:hypothetical protein